jgi:trigger factor
MQVETTREEGLSRAYRVTIPASELQARVDQELERLKSQVRLKGFRPGKTPMTHLRKMYGKAVAGDVTQMLAGEAADQVVKDQELRPVSRPDVQLAAEEDKVLTGDSDVVFDLQVELMPEIELTAPDSLELEKPVAEVDEEQVTESLKRLAQSATEYESKEGAAAEGDQVTIDFIGRIDGEAFEGGSAEDMTLVLGSGRFIPGFEEQLIGAEVDQKLDVTVTFPEEYPAGHLAGKTAVFETTVKDIAAPKEPELTDALAERFGADSLDDLRESARKRLERDYNQASRMKLKRQILDKLDEAHSFQLPERMVDAEFEGIWDQVQQAIAQDALDEEDKDKSEEELRTEYRGIAERRVRLGLVLAELGREHNIDVSEQEMAQALAQQARQYPGREQEVYQHFQNNPDALVQLRAPILEEKVIDYLIERANVTTKTVSAEDLLADTGNPDF